MTTIAVHNQTVACDSQITGNFKFAGAQKVRRVEEGPYKGWLFCAAGRLDYIGHAFAQVTSGEFSSICSSDDEDGGSYLLVGPKQVLCLDADKMSPYPVSRTFSIGSGCRFAMAAMECGKTPAEAVKVAAKLDPFTGGRIRTFTL